MNAHEEFLSQVVELSLLYKTELRNLYNTLISLNVFDGPFSEYDVSCIEIIEDSIEEIIESNPNANINSISLCPEAMKIIYLTMTISDSDTFNVNQIIGIKDMQIHTCYGYLFIRLRK